MSIVQSGSTGLRLDSQGGPVNINLNIRIAPQAPPPPSKQAPTFISIDAGEQIKSLADALTKAQTAQFQVIRETIALEMAKLDHGKQQQAVNVVVNPAQLPQSVVHQPVVAPPPPIETIVPEPSPPQIEAQEAVAVEPDLSDDDEALNDLVDGVLSGDSLAEPPEDGDVLVRHWKAPTPGKEEEVKEEKKPIPVSKIPKISKGQKYQPRARFQSRLPSSITGYSIQPEDMVNEQVMSDEEEVLPAAAVVEEVVNEKQKEEKKTKKKPDISVEIPTNTKPTLQPTLIPSPNALQPVSPSGSDTGSPQTKELKLQERRLSFYSAFLNDEATEDEDDSEYETSDMLGFYNQMGVSAAPGRRPSLDPNVVAAMAAQVRRGSEKKHGGASVDTYRSSPLAVLSPRTESIDSEEQPSSSKRRTSDTEVFWGAYDEGNSSPIKLTTSEKRLDIPPTASRAIASSPELPDTELVRQEIEAAKRHVASDSAVVVKQSSFGRGLLNFKFSDENKGKNAEKEKSEAKPMPKRNQVALPPRVAQLRGYSGSRPKPPPDAVDSMKYKDMKGQRVKRIIPKSVDDSPENSPRQGNLDHSTKLGKSDTVKEIDKGGPRKTSLLKTPGWTSTITTTTTGPKQQTPPVKPIMSKAARGKIESQSPPKPRKRAITVPSKQQSTPKKKELAPVSASKIVKSKSVQRPRGQTTSSAMNTNNKKKSPDTKEVVSALMSEKAKDKSHRRQVSNSSVSSSGMVSKLPKVMSTSKHIRKTSKEKADLSLPKI